MRTVTGLFLPGFVLGLVACSQAEPQPKVLNGHALVFRSGGIKLYPALRTAAVVTVNADRSIWPSDVLEAFLDPSREDCAVILYELSVSGTFNGEDRFLATRMSTIDTVDVDERTDILRTLNIPALDNPMNCPSEI